MVTIPVRYATPSDIPQVVQLFYDTVHIVNRKDYTEAQVRAWVPAVPDVTTWAKRWETRIVFVATECDADDKILGFAELESDGHIDCFYGHYAYQGKGVGRAMLERLEAEARQLGIDRLFTEVSITARPFFERMGYCMIRENQVIRNGVVLVNFSVEKHYKHSAIALSRIARP